MMREDIARLQEKARVVAEDNARAATESSVKLTEDMNRLADESAQRVAEQMQQQQQMQQQMFCMGF